MAFFDKIGGILLGILQTIYFIFTDSRNGIGFTSDLSEKYGEP